MGFWPSDRITKPSSLCVMCPAHGQGFRERNHLSARESMYCSACERPAHTCWHYPGVEMWNESNAAWRADRDLHSPSWSCEPWESIRPPHPRRTEECPWRLLPPHAYVLHSLKRAFLGRETAGRRLASNAVTVPVPSKQLTVSIFIKKLESLLQLLQALLRAKCARKKRSPIARTRSAQSYRRQINLYVILLSRHGVRARD